MRTKTLVAAAVALAAGVATSMAQSNVYSVNIVGYVNQTFPVGFSMVATPLKGTNDLVSTVLANAPAGTKVYKFVGGGYEASNLLDPTETPPWSNPNQLLPAGQGYLVKSTVQWTNTYVGEVVQDSTNALIAGYNMVGSVYPASGAIDSVLQLAPTAGDKVITFNNGAGTYNAANLYDPTETPAWGGGTPILNPAQGIYYKSVNAKNWVQHFVIP